MNIAWWLERAADEYGDRLALVDGRTAESWSYRTLRDRSAAVGTVLRERCGVRSDDVVCTLLPDNCWHTAVFYGTLRVGAVFSGFNRTLHFEKFAVDVQRLQASVLVVSSAYLDIAQRLMETTDLRMVILCDVEAADSGLTNLCAVDLSHGNETPIVARTEAQAAAVNFTGGTSGVSKGVIFPHGTLSLSAQAAMMFDRLVSADINLSCISLYHSGGIHDAVKWVMAGATNVLTGGWDAALAADLIAAYRPTWIYFWVPTMVRDLLRRADACELPLQGVKTILCGEPVPADLQRTLIDMGMIAQNSYGMTEVMPVGILKAIVAHGEEPPVGSCGRPLAELCDTVLKDPATGEHITDADVIGEVCVRGGVTSPGYYNDTDRTVAAFDHEGYLHTGDVASFDADGWWWLRGRTDDIINTGGEKLSLIEVEQVLTRHDVIRDVACVAVAHDRFGQVPAAVVELVDDHVDCDSRAADLDAHCRLHIERWKRPRLYIFVDAVPRTMPKRSKDMRALRALVTDIELSDGDPVRGMTVRTRHQQSTPTRNERTGQ